MSPIGNLFRAALLLCSLLWVSSSAQNSTSGNAYTPNIGSLAQLPAIANGTLLGNTPGCPGNTSGQTVAPCALAALPSTVTSIGNAINVTSVTYGASSANSDNATALQAAINAAITANVPLYIPASSACYKYTAPLTINGALTIRGDWVSTNAAGGINYPLGTPKLLGSVLCPTSNGSDAITISGTSTAVDISDIGILFQTPFSGTGNGITYAPSTQGLTGSHWRKVIVYGHDGNHYAFSLTNFIYNTFIDLQGFGGGGLNLSASSGVLHYGNSTFIDPYFQVMAGGSAHGFNVTAGGAQDLNLLTFIRPQALSGAASGVTPAPTSAQFTWTMDTNVQSIRVLAYDFESSVGSVPLFNTDPTKGNQFDYWGGYSTSNASTAPAWTTNGIVLSGPVQNLTDTTSSGTVALTAVAAIPADFVAATSATTYTDLVTLYVPSPHASTNVTATNLYAIEANGPVKVPALTVTGSSGFNSISTSGTASLNGNATVGGSLTVTSTSQLNGQVATAFNESGYTYGAAGSGTYLGRNCSNGGNEGCIVGVGGLSLYAVAASSQLASTTPTLKVNSSNATFNNGPLNITGSSSGTISVSTQAAAGTYNFNLPITAGSSGQVLTSGGGGSTAMTWANAAPTYSYLSFQPGLVAAVVNTKSSFAKLSKASTVDNIEVSASSFTCAANPTITMYECGTSTTCAAPTTIGSATITTSGTVVDGTVSNSAITAGDYVAWAISAGTCTSLDIAANAQVHTN